MRNISLNTRILLTASLAVLFLIIGLTFISRVYITKRYEKDVINKSKGKKFELQREIDDISSHAGNIAVISSELPAVKEAFSLFVNNAGKNKAQEYLKQNTKSIENSLQKVSKMQMSIDFVAKSGEKLATIVGESDFNYKYRKSLEKVNKYRSAFGGIELANSGLVIFGISPVFDENLKYLGAVTVNIPLEEFFASLYSAKDEAIATYVEVNEFSDYKNDTIHHRVGAYLLHNSSSNRFNTKIVDREIIDKAIEFNNFHNKKRAYFQNAFPIFDSNKDIVGVFVHQFNSELNTDLKFQMSLLLMFVGVAFSALIFIFLYIYNRNLIIQPLQQIKSSIKKLRTGADSVKLKFNSKDEIADIGKELNSYIEYRKRVIALVKDVDDDTVDELNLQGLNENDKLVLLLKQLQKRLKDAKTEAEKRKREETVRNWESESLANFNRIIREHSDLERLTDAVLKELIEILGANQGGFFIMNDDNESENNKFELVSSYAYDRKRFHEKEVLEGEGLIGMVAIEKEPLYLTEIPDTYVELTSGLGKTLPSCILIVPLIQENNVLGIIELASLNEFEDYKIEFAKDVAKSISSSISMTKINKQTRILFEETKFQAEQMAAQEEEMRQNMEELTATQEEMSKKEALQAREIEDLKIKFEKKIAELKDKESEMKSVLDALNFSTYLIELDLDGNIIFINDYAAQLLGKTKAEIIGKPQTAFIQYSDIKIQRTRAMWQQLLEGETVKTSNRIIINNREVWLAETYTPILDDMGKTRKILKISHNITKEKSKEQELKDAMDKINTIKSSQSRTIDKIVKRSERIQAKLRAEIKELKKELNNKKS